MYRRCVFIATTASRTNLLPYLLWSDLLPITCPLPGRMCSFVSTQREQTVFSLPNVLITLAFRNLLSGLVYGHADDNDNDNSHDSGIHTSYSTVQRCLLTFSSLACEYVVLSACIVLCHGFLKFIFVSTIKPRDM